MDIDRMKPADRVSLCRKYFFIGFACLPFLWLVNAIWFGHFVFMKKGITAKEQARLKEAADAGAEGEHGGQSSSSRPGPSRHRHRDEGGVAAPPPVDPTVDEDRRRGLASMRWYVIMSAIGALIWAIVITVWVIIFQVNRVAWDEFGDDISFNIPRGIP